MTYILPLAAVLLGAFIGLIFQPKNRKNLKLLLAFSGAFLLTITVTHLLPEVYMHELESLVHHDHDHAHDHSHDHGAAGKIGLFIMIGIVFQIVLEYFSKGAEHGHVHREERSDSIPWTLFVSLCLHALFEGAPLSQHHELAWGISVHHFPIAIILTLFFLNGGIEKFKALLLMALFGLMTPLGTFLSENSVFLTDYYIEISAIVVGILFHISSTIIFESSENHKFNFAKLAAIVLGIVLGYFA